MFSWGKEENKFPITVSNGCLAIPTVGRNIENRKPYVNHYISTTFGGTVGVGRMTLENDELVYRWVELQFSFDHTVAACPTVLLDHAWHADCRCAMAVLTPSISNILVNTGTRCVHL